MLSNPGSVSQLLVAFLCMSLFYAGDKEGQVRSEEYGKDISSVQTLITKQETFDAGLAAFENESIANLTAMKEELLANKHARAVAIRQRHLEVMKR